MRSTLREVYQLARHALREGDHVAAMDYLALAADNHHPVAVRLYKSLGKKPRTIHLHRGRSIDIIPLRADPELAASLPLPPLTSYPPLHVA